MRELKNIFENREIYENNDMLTIREKYEKDIKKLISKVSKYKNWEIRHIDTDRVEIALGVEAYLTFFRNNKDKKYLVSCPSGKSINKSEHLTDLYVTLGRILDSKFIDDFTKSMNKFCEEVIEVRGY